ncbi:MAG TPA: OmpW family outer membrane protein [Thermoanaerobaculia bacterium]|nr:OmpW family outer membrane protein [Thermoanaerobaculia bacterium]
MRIRILVSLAVLLFTFSLSAQSNHISVFISDTSFKTTTQTDPDIGRVKLSFHSKSGYGIGFDHFVSPNLSFHASAERMHADTRVDLSDQAIGGNVGTLDLNEYDAALHWYFLSHGRVRPFAGAGLARIQGGKIHTPGEFTESGLEETTSLDSKTTWLVDAGLDIGVGANGAVVLSAKYRPYKTRFGAAPGDPVQFLHLDPVTYAAGFRWRF